MAFVQIIEFTTSRYDEGQALEREWEAATEGKRTVQRSVMGRDRNDPTRHVLIVFFDSYEAAMENSNLPETQEFTAKWGALADGPPRFIDLDVLEDRAG
jgi:quinol monooxygenase YgiN